MDLIELVKDAIETGLSGNQIDTLVKGFGINFLDPANPRPALVVPVQDAAAFQVLAESGITGVVLSRNFNFVSVFPPAPSSFPVARVYRLAVRDMFEFARIGKVLERVGISVKPMLDEQFQALLEPNGHQQRIASYYAGHEERTTAFSSLAAGRLSSTFVRKCFLFDSKGCLVCGRDAGLVTTTLGDPSDPECQNIMLCFYLCAEHTAKAGDDLTYYHFLKRHFGQPAPPWMVGRPSLEFLTQCAVDFLTTQLDCRILKVRDNVITAVRPSGFRIVLRLRDGSYAYMFFNAAGEEVKRIDDTPHHSVAFGPHHLHRAPGKDNKDVVSSFTYGFPPWDAKIIRRVLDEHGG